MKLTPDQRQAMINDGYLIVRGCVPAEAVDRAVQRINHDLGDLGLPPEQLPEFRQRSYCPQITRDPAILDVANQSPLFEVGEAMLGKGNLQAIDHGQIALRFPTAPGTPPKEPRGHLDGIGTGTNGIDKGDFIRNFSMLAVVLLSDLPDPNAGNFTVWPGSHTFFENHFKQHGWADLHQGMPHHGLPREPIQITGEPGDVCFAHHQLVHAACGNFAPHIRYATIYRLKHTRVAQIGKDALTDIWKEWEGLR